MCGIWAFIQLKKKKISYTQFFNDFMNMRPRGPDHTSFQIIKNLTLGFHRLAIMEPKIHANQPYILEDDERTIIFMCNGEIYNFQEIIHEHKLDINDNSDCMTIPKLYLKYVKYNPNGNNDISKFVELFKINIKSEHAFILFELDKLQNLKEIIISRDHIGIRPLYYGFEYENNENNENYNHIVNILFSSEIKGMQSYNGDVNEFCPGTMMHCYIDNLQTISYIQVYNTTIIYNIIPLDEIRFKNEVEIEDYFLKKIRDAVFNSVKRRLNTDAGSIAFLLSGGVDSSITCAIATKLLGRPINTFCCGMQGSTDLKFAKIASDYMGTHHTEVIFTPEFALSQIRKVIYDTESWDTTTIRASIGQSIVCNYISKNTDATVIMCSEGPDEVASSYMHQWYAPSGNALHASAQEYVSEMHAFDVKRADRNISNASCEGRVPLLDPEFISEYWSIPSNWRKPTYKNMEKWWLRKAFDGLQLLPDCVLWRKKEAFSDGLSSAKNSWFKILQNYIEEEVSNEEFLSLNEFNCPTKESYYYMKIFVDLFGKKRISIIPHYWQAKFKSDGTIVDFNDIKSYEDPSARTLKIYTDVEHE